MRSAPHLFPIFFDATWVDASYTTDPPRYIWHKQWFLRLTVRADAPLRVVVLERDGAIIRWTKLGDRRNRASMTIATRLDEEPSELELADPWSSLSVSEPVDAVTWSIIPLSPGAEWAKAIMVFPRDDTELLRAGRWRIRRALAAELPAAMISLQRGAWTGSYEQTQPEPSIEPEELTMPESREEQLRRAFADPWGIQAALVALHDAPLELVARFVDDLVAVSTGPQGQVAFAREVLARLDPAWLGRELGPIVWARLDAAERVDAEEAAAARPSTPDAYWQYRALAAMLRELHQRSLLAELILRARQSHDPEVREVAEDFAAEGERPGGTGTTE